MQLEPIVEQLQRERQADADLIEADIKVHRVAVHRIGRAHALLRQTVLVFAVVGIVIEQCEDGVCHRIPHVVQVIFIAVWRFAPNIAALLIEHTQARAPFIQPQRKAAVFHDRMIAVRGQPVSRFCGKGAHHGIAIGAGLRRGRVRQGIGRFAAVLGESHRAEQQSSRQHHGYGRQHNLFSTAHDRAPPLQYPGSRRTPATKADTSPPSGSKRSR